jgi:Protein of unknown function (DUF3224)
VAAAVMSLALSVAAQKEMHVVHAKGSFDIKMTPVEPTDFEKANDITRVTSDKTWHGDFEGVSHGEMITGSTASTGSMAYVAIERMTGKLHLLAPRHHDERRRPLCGRAERDGCTQFRHWRTDRTHWLAHHPYRRSG